MIPQKYTLDNGLQVIFVDTKSTSLTALLLVGAGSRYEDESNNGIAHFFEHMAFKGSQKYPNSFIISSTIEGIGGMFNAFTSKDHTGYWIKSTPEHFETCIDVLADMVQHSLLLDEEINREKGVITEEINMYEDMPIRKIGDLFEELLYQGNPLGLDIAGKKEGIIKFNRQTFIDYINNLYHPNNAVLVIAGGISQKSKVKSQKLNSKVKSNNEAMEQWNNYIKIIEKKFINWKTGEKSTFVEIKESQLEPQTLIKYKKTEQAHFCLGYRAFSFNDKRKYVLKILSAVLGGGMSSRLFTQVRERRGLCYYISTSSQLYADCGNMVTQAGVTNSKDKINEAIKVILDEHKKITAGDIKSDELTRAKELIKGRFLLSLEDSANVANTFGSRLLLQNTTETPDQIVSHINQININEVVTLAKEIFVRKNLNLALIGPYKDKDINLQSDDR